MIGWGYDSLKAHIYPKFIAPRARQSWISCDTKLSKNRILHIYFNPPV